MPLDPVYEVVSPLGEAVAPDRSAAAGEIASAAPLADLHDKRIGFIWTKFRNGDVLLDAFADLLSQRYRGMEFVKLPSGRDLPWGEYPDQTFSDVVREHRVDAVIAAPGC